ncbi:hypothetical protein HRbin33_02656 [bacterium HR33]|nr:hypothetical protein HRbin33_02656 [bacterium HR33]
MKKRRRASRKIKRAKAKSLGELPRFDVTWEADLKTVAEIFPGVAEHARPWRIGLWVETETELALGFRLMTENTPLEELVSVLPEAANRPPAGPPRRPARIAVRDPRLAQLLQERIGDLGIEVDLVQRLDVWDRVVRHLGGSLPGLGPVDSYLAGQGVEPKDVAAFFEAAAEYFRLAPWTCLDDDEPIELTWPGRPESIWAVVLGGAEMTYGLALYFSGAELAELYQEEDADAPPRGECVAVAFDTEDILPPGMRAERRRYRWPVAGPKAYPIPMHSFGSRAAPADREDLALLTLSLRVVAELVRRYGRDLRRTAASPVEVEITGPGGGFMAVQARVSSDWAEGKVAEHAGLKPEEAAFERGEEISLLEEMRDRIFRLSGAKRAIDRLAWSFFQDSAPNYAGREQGERVQALGRFLDWALFAARTWPEGRTLAEQALEAAAGELSAEELEVRRRFCQPRYSIYQVTGVQMGEGLELKDQFTGERLQVRERIASYEIRRGWTIIGPLFPVGDRYVLASAPLVYDRQLPIPEGASLPKDARKLAPALEEIFFGAGTGWIEKLALWKLADKYEDFRSAVSGPEGELPSFAELQRLARSAALPSQAMQPIMDKVDWWTLQEAKVFASFFTRTWNLVRRGL